ncbi:MAG: ATP-binding protein, partial [Saprospiraceae bacterium]|nr:ATP-binding protein [Saprospiraceae bacterium]
MTGHEDIRSPFKFLDPYTRGDQDIFFGRDEEVEKLYESVNKNRLVLVYGQSGTGKTSLVQCGLANRFEVTDWMPFFIRRGANINASLCQALSQSKAMGGSDIQPEQVTAALGRISDRYVRPVYLIFDQFEELMILGEPPEIEAFTLLIRDIMDGIDTQSTYLLFILREEYFGWLDEFEHIVPGFSDRRLRVEPMRPAKLEEVIMQTCASFNVTLEKGRENARQIIDSLRSKGGISLPYLQVYLDMLWREDYQRTDLSSWNGQGHPPLEFTTQEIESFGNIEDVLGRFL